MDVCQALLELVDAGALGMIDPAAARAAQPATVDDVPVAEAPAPQLQSPPEPRWEPRAEAVAPTEPPAAPESVTSPVVLTIVPEASPEPASPPVPDQPAPTEPDGPEPTPVSEVTEAADPRVAAATGSEGPDRGAFLRLFSGLRES